MEDLESEIDFDRESVSVLYMDTFTDNSLTPLCPVNGKCMCVCVRVCVCVSRCTCEWV